jgi:hypothetical protein
MEMELIRQYYAIGTNGTIFYQGIQIVHSIELPWKDNRARVSCIPEGRYELIRRNNPRFGQHLLLKEVPDREYILIHPANDALLELQGCIAPVSILTGEGKGQQSRLALQKLNGIADKAFAGKEQVFLTIKSIHYEND